MVGLHRLHEGMPISRRDKTMRAAEAFRESGHLFDHIAMHVNAHDAEAAEAAIAIIDPDGPLAYDDLDIFTL